MRFAYLAIMTLTKKWPRKFSCLMKMSYVSSPITWYLPFESFFKFFRLKRFSFLKLFQAHSNVKLETTDTFCIGNSAWKEDGGCHGRQTRLRERKKHFALPHSSVNGILDLSNNCLIIWWYWTIRTLKAYARYFDWKKDNELTLLDLSG